ncbi:SPX domain gene 4 [Euphorbia peplus]|nr:SPX domain gene 4 [Euphorbia peplus]
MKFGKEFKTHLEETLPEWRDKFLCYKPLKKILKQFPSFSIDPVFLLNQRLPPFPLEDHLHPEGAPNGGLLVFQEWFIRILNEELEKFNDFYVDKEEEFIIRFQELKERIEFLKEQSSKNGVFTSESEFSEEMMDIRKDLVTIHGEMVLLKNYSSLNFAGLLKILKKYDKRTGELLRLPFTQLALRQPFFTTEPLTRLVHECEANLELLFPLQAEVIESSSSVQKQSEPRMDKVTSTSPETPTRKNDTMDIYRSTLAAMKAIRGLQKASSTYNPLSISFLFKNQDDESTGAVTAENSASNSPPKGEESDEDDAHSV